MAVCAPIGYQQEENALVVKSKSYVELLTISRLIDISNRNNLIPAVTETELLYCTGSRVHC